MTLLLSHHMDRVVGPRIGLLADTVNDADSTRKVYLLAAGLAVLGVALVVVTVWFWRSTRHDPELLAPLEVMGGRRFKRLETGVQREVLDRSRPADAQPMRWGVRRGEASGGPEIDLRENQRTAPAGYDDLLDPALIAVAVAETDDHARGRVPAVAAAEAAAATGSPTPEPAAATNAVEDIDSALAAVGAKVDLPGVPVPAVKAPAVPSRPSAVTVSPVGTGAAATAAAAAAAVAAASPATAAGSTAKPPAGGGATDGPMSSAAPKPTAASSTPIAPSGTAAMPAGAGSVDPAPSAGAADAPVLAPRGNKPGPQANEAQPLVIVPVDHELRPSRPPSTTKKPSAPDAEPADEDATAAAEQPVVEESNSIDPLLRMVNRNDG